MSTTAVAVEAPPETTLPSDGELLLALVMDEVAFQSPDGRLYLDLTDAGHRSVSISSARFREWLSASFAGLIGRAPSRYALSTTIMVLKARAAFGPVRDIDLRATTFNRFDDRSRTDEIFIDLGRRKAETIRITGDGWTIQPPGTGAMRLAPGALPLPTPDLHGSLEPLRPLLNLSCDQDWIRIQSWLVSALNPSGPYPVLVLEGPERTGKSTAAAFLRSLVDPVSVPLAALPSRDAGVFKYAMENRIAVFDDVARLSPAVSSALCQLSSGIGYTFKEPYAKDAPVTLQLTRPVILTTRKLKLDKSLKSRALVVELPPMADHVSSREMEARFAKIRPTVLGGLCDAISAALRRRDTLELTELPGQADAALWSAAALEHVDPEEVLDAFLPWQYAESDEWSAAIIRFTAERITWSGSATDLLQQLRQLAIPGLPLTAKGLSQRLARLDSGALEIAFPRLPGGRRQIRLTTILNQIPHDSSQPRHLTQFLPPPAILIRADPCSVAGLLDPNGLVNKGVPHGPAGHPRE